MTATTVVTGRLDGDTLAQLDAWAKAHRLGRSPAVAHLLRIALSGEGGAFTVDDAPAPRPAPARSATVVTPAKRERAAAPAIDARKVLAEAEAKAAHLAHPKAKASKDDDIGYVPAGWGENRAAPGSRLKGATKLR